MWLWIFLALALVITVLTVARNAFRRGVRDEVVRYLKVHRPSWALVKVMPSELILKPEGADEVTFKLQRLFRQAAGIPGSNQENRPPIYEQSLAALEGGLA